MDYMLESNLEELFNSSSGLNEETLTLINDNILVLLEKLDYLTEIQFTFLVLSITIVILGVIYTVISKFIR